MMMFLACGYAILCVMGTYDNFEHHTVFVLLRAINMNCISALLLLDACFVLSYALLFYTRCCCSYVQLTAYVCLRMQCLLS